MERRIGPLWADVIEPESAKFTAPLMLIHGLWSSTAIWRPFVGYLAHRGWLCVCVRLSTANSKPAFIAGYQSHLRDVVGGLPAAPVVIGHDLGALLALQIADMAVAVVGLAPLVPRSMAPPAQALVGRRLDRWLGRSSGPPGGRWREHFPLRFGREEQGLLREIRDDAIAVPPLPDEKPGLVIAGDRDAVVPLTAAQALAERIGAEFQVERDAGHALPVERGWERRVSELHRWTVQRVGRSLLALYDESLFE